MISARTHFAPAHGAVVHRVVELVEAARYQAQAARGSPQKENRRAQHARVATRLEPDFRGHVIGASVTPDRARVAGQPEMLHRSCVYHLSFEFFFVIKKICNIKLTCD